MVIVDVVSNHMTIVAIAIINGIVVVVGGGGGGGGGGIVVVVIVVVVVGGGGVDGGSRFDAIDRLYHRQQICCQQRNLSQWNEGWVGYIRWCVCDERMCKKVSERSYKEACQRMYKRMFLRGRIEDS